MNLASLAASLVPLMQWLFPPTSLLDQVHHTPTLIFGVLELCLAAAFTALWRAAPDYRVFRSLGIFYSVVGTEQFLQYFGGSIPTWSLRAIAVAILVETAGEAMQVPNRGWTRLFWPVYAFVSIAAWFPSMAAVNELPVLCSEVALAILIIQGFRRGSRRDRMIAAAFSVHFLVRLCLSTSVQRLTGIRNYATIGGWQWQYTTVTLTSLGAVTLAIFVRDLLHVRAEQQRLAAELAAGRAVQQMLISKDAPAIAGFSIQSVYSPVGEVGGDFFQILPAPDGGIVIAIGDVSGKGTPAALTVSLLVGTLHALVETTTSPALLLAGLNRSARNRSCGGFTTCLVLRIDPHGALTIANAGHIPPYRNGEELLCDNGLPLGLIAEAAYSETTFVLGTGQQLTLVTDGVVEARSATGELFGFERTAAIAAGSAESIVQRAQQFGQEDDITVLALAREATA